MNETKDELQIKIDKARLDLPEESRQAIDAVNWKTAILELRTKRGYTFEQLGDLETETELLLCGLTRREDYPKELSRRMGISQAETDSLIKEINELIFEKVRQELIKITEREKSKAALDKAPAPQNIAIKTPPKLNSMEIAAPAGAATPSMIAQKFSGSVTIPIKKTEHTLSTPAKPTAPSYEKNRDPYRLSPDE